MFVSEPLRWAVGSGQGYHCNGLIKFLSMRGEVHPNNETQGGKPAISALR